jgi:hypothetical protein
MMQSIFPYGKGASIQWTEGWVGLRDELETLRRRKNKSLSGIEIQFSGHPVRNVVTD